MQKLNFPDYKFRFKKDENLVRIFDIVRKKYVVLTPEEWVRQHVIHFLVSEKRVPGGLIMVESEIRLYNTTKRFDIAVFDQNGQPVLAIECKAPGVSITQGVVDQLVRYNMSLKVRFLMLSNGLVHLFCKTDPESGNIKIIKDLPEYPNLH